MLVLLALLAAPLHAAPAASTPRSAPEVVDEWAAMLDRTTPAIVAIQFRSPRFFDTEGAFDAVATGFVVDRERGILLTNRHVVNPGPSVAEAVFLDHEEVPIQAIYRDPVHDFGFYRFDPKAVKYQDLVELPLAPDAAKVGTEIRVVGNDAGEKISILAGTLARLDRRAPDYGNNEFNDFNTFYYQAASSTSGGSSGSPVLDVQGRVVALNAGGSNRAATSFYLPLDRVVRALRLVQAGKPVTRGTVQAEFVSTDYDELRRLGLRPDTEAAFRKRDAKATGMLTVQRVVPGGPADGKLEPGDILTTVDGRPMTTFLPLEGLLDDGVGRDVHLGIERGGRPMDVTLPIQDLHAITPSEYVEVGDGVLNPLSLMQARNHNVPVGGAYVAYPGYVLGKAGIPQGAWLLSVDGRPTPTLAVAEAALAAIPDGRRAEVRYVDVSDPQAPQVSLIAMNRSIFPMRHCRRDDATGLWPCVDSPAPPPAPPVAPTTVRLPAVEGKVAQAVAPSLVFVDCRLPFRIEGVPSDSFSGMGVVIDAERGLVLVDRNTVPIALAEVSLTVGGQLRVPARVVFLHPEHNWAVVQYDPARLGDTPVRAAEFDARPLGPKDKLVQVGLNARLRVQTRSISVGDARPWTLQVPATPSFRDYNLELLESLDSPPDKGGVVVDGKGHVRAWWASFIGGWGESVSEAWQIVPAAALLDDLEAVIAGRAPDTRSLGVEWVPLTLSVVRDYGLPGDLVARLAEHAEAVMGVNRIAADVPAAQLLRVGDLLVSANGEPVPDFRALDAVSAAPSVRLSIWREGRLIDVDVPTRAPPANGVTRALLWAGAILHEQHLPVAIQRNIAPAGVYVAWAWYGSPADHDNLRGTTRILAVDDVPTPDLDAFVAAVSGRADRATLRLKVADLDGRTDVRTLRLDLQYWPTAEVREKDGVWTRVPVAASPMK